MNEFQSFEDCIKALGTYDRLYHMFEYLNRYFSIKIDLDTTDTLYNEIQRRKVFELLNLFDFETTNEDIDLMLEFLGDNDFTDVGFDKKCVKFIVNNIVPRHKEYLHE